MTNLELAALLTAVATSASAVATAAIAWATLRYARGTNALAQATLTGVDAQIAASRDQLAASEKLAHVGIRAQIVSHTRLAWIDAVRDAIAELLSLDAEIKKQSASLLGREFVDNIVQRRLMIRYRIEFRLDPGKPAHSELIQAVDNLIDDASHSVHLVREVRDLTVRLAEEEWRRVRREVGAPVSVDSPASHFPLDPPNRPSASASPSPQ